MNSPRPEHLLTGLAAIALASSIGWFGLRSPEISRAPAIALSDSAYAPTAPAAPDAGTTKWPAPPAQRRGRDWVYEVFTPPEIFYDARTEQFTVAPPDAERERPAPPFGLTLRRVERKLYPLQLVGYAGAPGDYRGVFENETTAETFLGGTGRAVDRLGLTIVRLEVRPAPLILPESTTAHPLVAVAVVRDDRTGEEVTLSSAERLFTAAPVAYVAPVDAPDELREVREGDTFSLGAARFTVGPIQLDPSTVEVTEQTADQPQPVRRVLTPAEAASPSNS